jgi:hypothetical protein
VSADTVSGGDADEDVAVLEADPAGGVVPPRR